MDVEGQDYIKPMNCPFHLSIYNANHHSYRELPVRLAELGTQMTALNAAGIFELMRVRGFTQDDAQSSVLGSSERGSGETHCLLSLDMLKSFGFKDFMIYLSTKPEASVVDEAEWLLKV